MGVGRAQESGDVGKTHDGQHELRGAAATQPFLPMLAARFLEDSMVVEAQQDRLLIERIPRTDELDEAQDRIVHADAELKLTDHRVFVKECEPSRQAGCALRRSQLFHHRFDARLSLDKGCRCPSGRPADFCPERGTAAGQQQTHPADPDETKGIKRIHSPATGSRLYAKSERTSCLVKKKMARS